MEERQETGSCAKIKSEIVGLRNLFLKTTFSSALSNVGRRFSTVFSKFVYI